MEALQILNSQEAVEAVNRVEVDIAISTAKNYPREIEKAKNEIYSCATSSRETAESCFYALPRGGKTIEGPSVRLAEIIEYCFGNINSGFRIVGNDGKKITAQAVAHDLERNNRVMIEISRRITKSDGKVYDQDMQIVTGNAAGSIAWRNAIFKLIPNAVWIDIQKKIKEFIVGGAAKDSKEFLKRRTALMQRFLDLGADEKKVCEMMKVNSVKDLDTNRCFILYGVLTAINEGTSSVEEVFGIKTGQTSDTDFEDDAPEGDLLENPEQAKPDETKRNPGMPKKEDELDLK